MAFVLEKISEEDKKKYNINPVYTDVWPIDRDRNTILLYNGCAAFEEASFFELHWNDYIIKITTKEKGDPSKNEPKKKDVYYDIIRILIPIQLKEAKDEVLNIIDEGLRTWGRFGSKELTATVSISYPKENDSNKSRDGIRFINSEKLN